MTKRSTMSAPLGERQFRLLFSAQAVSNLGDWFDFLALTVLIAYTWHKGPGALAALAIVIAIPYIAVSPFAGVLADRWPRRATMIGCDLLRAGIVLSLVAAPNLIVLLTLVFLKHSVSTLFNPAEQATIRLLVPEEQLHAANSLSNLVSQGSKVIGPALGGLLMSRWSPHVAFVIDSASFVGSAAFLSLLPRRAGQGIAGERNPTEEPSGFLRELREGIQYIFSRRALLVATASLCAAIFLLFAFDAMSPLAFRELGASKWQYGLAVAAIGLGGAAGAVLVGRFANELNPFVLLGFSKVVIGAMVAVIGFGLLAKLGAPPLLWVPVLLVVGLASAGLLISLPTILQRETPAALMGRVSATTSAVPTVFQVAAPIIGAAIAQWLGLGTVFVAAGAGLALLGLGVWVIRPAVGVGVDALGPELTVTETEVVGFVDPPSKGDQLSVEDPD